MELSEVIKTQIDQAHTTMLQVVEDLSDEQLHHRLPGATINPIAGVLAHAVISEDRFTNAVLRGDQRLFETGWGERLGLVEAERDHRFEDFALRDRAAFMQYANEVFAGTERYLASVRPDDLERPVKLRDRELPAGQVLARLVAGHSLQHSGEMAAIKGAMGLKGLPF